MEIGTLFDVRGRTALVTGGSRGIGAMIAEGLLRAGMTVHICARKQPEIDAAIGRLSVFGPCHAVRADLSTPEGVSAVVAHMTARAPVLDLLVNNAGITHAMPFADFDRTAFEKVFSLNVTAAFELSRQLLPLLTAASTPDNPARIVNIASVEGLRPPAWESYPYSASKAALIMLTRHLAARLAPAITVNAVAAGLFKSKMTEFLFAGDKTRADLPIPLRRAGRAEEIAGTVIYLASRAGGYLTGAVLPVSGGVATADTDAAS